MRDKICAALALPVFIGGGFTNTPITMDAGMPAAAHRAAEAWNTHTGVELFVVGDDPRVVLVDGEGGTPWARMLPSRNEPYERCEVYVNGFREDQWVHELGHCLGLADAFHDEDDMYEGAAHCDSYTGVMSYCEDEPALSSDDIAALGELGYPVCSHERTTRHNRTGPVRETKWVACGTIAPRH